MTACVEWTGYRNQRGYGVVYVDGKRWFAHRHVFFKTHGYLPPVVRHACDNPPCVAVDHLVAGTQADNLQDAVDRGRARRAKGEELPFSKLTRGDIPVIRTRLQGGHTVTAVARDYNVDRKTIRRIRDGQTWKSV